MGPRTALWLLKHRLQKKLFIHQSKQHVLKSNGFSSWQRLQQLYKLNNFDHFFLLLIQKNFCKSILNDTEFIQSLPPAYTNKTTLFQMADNIIKGSISILGYGTFILPASTIPWHHDITCSQQGPPSWQKDFFSDITIAACSSMSEHRLPDIKTPWELSRLQHFFILGLASQHAQDNHDHARARNYCNTFLQHTTDWIEQNAYLHGVNWVNPMEVAIRSINLIWAFHFFKNNLHISQHFWQQFIGVLHDHMIYLEHTWEVSDKPNNHYLANLLGHFYLCSFLDDLATINNKRMKTLDKLLQQLQHQILPDGTSYEGSTNYHRLVTEIMMHLILLCKYTHIALPPNVQKIYTQMKQFLSDCTDQGGNLVQIGDNDSGKIVAGFHYSSTTTHHHAVLAYPDFGISIIKYIGWHITLRHPTYQLHQPSGHFHQDMLSCTLSIDGIPILIDPGTYVYTAQPTLRNQFRSIHSHNTLFANDHAHPTHTDLFQLKRIPHKPQSYYTSSKNNIKLEASYDYLPNQLIAHRSIQFEMLSQTCTITDWWTASIEIPSSSSWRLHFSPLITLQQNSRYTWVIKHHKNSLASLTTTLDFEIIEDTISHEYGSIIPSKTLVATSRFDQQHQIIISRLNISSKDLKVQQNFVKGSYAEI